MDSGENVAYGFWQISESIALSRYLQEIYQVIVSVVSKILNLKVCSLMTIDEERKELHVRAAYGASPYFIGRSNVIMKIWEGVSGRTIREQRAIEIRDVRAEEQYRFADIARKDGLVSLISIPIRVGKKILGVLNGYTGEEHVFTKLEIAVLKAAANQAALAIETHRLREDNDRVRAGFEQRELIERATVLLMEKKGLKEDEAAGLLRQSSQQYHKPLAEMAEAVILSFSFEEKPEEKRSGHV